MLNRAAQIVYEYVEKKRPQDRALWHAGGYLKMVIIKINSVMDNVKITQEFYWYVCYLSVILRQDTEYFVK
jgi:hypothetical protein